MMNSVDDEFLRFFPKPSFYANQYDAMKAIHKALFDGRIVLFEGACGTGKTLSSLAASLDVAAKNDKLVVIVTSVHQQMLQFIEEGRSIRNGGADINVIVLKGKLHMCPSQMSYEECDVLRENTYDLTRDEQELQQLQSEIKNVEEQYKESKDSSLIEMRDQLIKEAELKEENISRLKERYCEPLHAILEAEEDYMQKFKKWLFSDVRTPEEVIEKASKDGMCGYELLKRCMKKADLVICNYHHVLNYDVLMTFLNWVDRGLDDIIMIFDEAHNIENSARTHASQTLSDYTLRRAIGEAERIRKEIMPEVDIGDVEQLLEALNSVLHETYESCLGFGELERVGEAWHDLRIREPDGREDVFTWHLLKAAEEMNVPDVLREMYLLGVKVNNWYREQYKIGASEKRWTSYMLSVAGFMMDYMEFANSPSYYPFISVRLDKNHEISARLELFMCIPKSVTQPLFQSLHAAVLMSATLRPFPVVIYTLGINRPVTEIQYGSAFPLESRLSIAVATPPLFARDRDDQGTIRLIGNAISDITEQSEGNILLFFPSYHEAKRYHELLQDHLSVDMLLDEVGTSAQEIREQFFNIGERGGKVALFTYLWGTLTEGVDYRDNRARTVVVIGVGYPALTDRMQAIQHAYDQEFGLGHGWGYAVEIPTIRKIRQAMGRIIRSPEDYGARALLDARYTEKSAEILGRYSVYDDFPEEERAEFVDVEPDRLQYSLMNFFTDMKRELQPVEGEEQ